MTDVHLWPRMPAAPAALALLVVWSLALPAVGAGDFRVREYGAQGDGRALDTPAIQRAIDACAAGGGGLVRFPVGVYLTGTLHLRSGVELRLDRDARILGAPDPALYDQFAAAAGGAALPRNDWHRGLILGQGVTNIALTGEGVIDGNDVFDPKGEERMRGPHLILLGGCSRVTLRGLTLRRAANYAFFYLHTDDVRLDSVTFLGGWDGVHFRASEEHWNRGLRITGCRFFTGDDAIAGHYQQDAVIADCTINSSCNGLRVIGPVRNFEVARCDFSGPGRFEHRVSKRTNMLAAVCLQPGAWTPTPGRMDDVWLHDLTMKEVSTPFHIATREGNTFGRLLIERIRARGAYRAPISVEAWGEPTFDEVVLRDLEAEFTGGGTDADAALEARRPGVDARKLPAWGLYVRGVNHLTLDRVTLTTRAPDARPAILTNGVVRLDQTASRFESAR